MRFEKFEDMKVWQDSRELTNAIYALTTSGKFSRDFGLRDQIQRAAVSVMSNIAEGYERANRKEFIVFLLYAKGSVGEVRSQLYVASDLSYITIEQFNKATAQALEVALQLGSFVKYLRANPK
jgi:four helix bundle protein